MKNLLIAFIGLLLIASCKKKDEPIAVDGVAIPSTASAATDTTVTLTATVMPENATDKSLTWISSAENIATVAEGVVTGKSAGTVTITVASKSNPDKSARCTVTVTVSVKGVTLPAAESVATGATLPLTATVMPENATDKSLTWTSSAENIAAVAEGVVTGKLAGTAIITAASRSNPRKLARCSVTVTAAPLVPLTGLGVEPSAASVLVNRTRQLTPIFTPANAADKAVTWTSSDETIAAVAPDGLVTAKDRTGTVTITLKSKNQQTIAATCVITVTATPVALTDISVEPTLSLEARATHQLRPTLTPSGTTETSLTYSSSNEEVASVSPTGGLVTALTVGTTTITVTSVSDPTKTATCEVRVTPVLVKRITVTAPRTVLLEDETLQLTAVVEPSHAANKAVNWISRSNQIATFPPTLPTGVIRAVSAGTVTIWALSTDRAHINEEVRGILDITVTRRVRGIAITPAVPTVLVGGTMRLAAVVTPLDAPQAVTWRSSDESKATVNAEGEVRGAVPGEVDITAVATDGSGFTGTVKLLVVATLSADVTVSAITLGNEGFVVGVPAVGATATVTNVPRTVAFDIRAVKLNITAAAGASIKIRNNDFASGSTTDFTEPVTFTVTAQNGTTEGGPYTVAITPYNAETNPYGIYTPAHLNDVRNDLGASYKMRNDITLPDRNAAGAAAVGISDYATAGWAPIGTIFTGKFDGGNFSINNFYINRGRSGEYIGLFGELRGAVRNLGITGSATPAVTGGRYVGALAGQSFRGSVTNCYAHVAVRSVLQHDEAFAGGLIGLMIGGSLSNSYSSGDVSGELTGSEFGEGLNIGGLAGLTSTGAVLSNCFSTGNISAACPKIYGGGLAGRLGAYAGGCTTVNCYATGNVACTSGGNNIGRLGSSAGNTFTNCYRNSESVLTSNGAAVTESSPSGVTNKTRAQMQDDAFKGNLTGTVWGRDNNKNGGLPYIIGVGVGK